MGMGGCSTSTRASNTSTCSTSHPGLHRTLPMLSACGSTFASVMSTPSPARAWTKRAHDESPIACFVLYTQYNHTNDAGVPFTCTARTVASTDPGIITTSSFTMTAPACVPSSWYQQHCTPALYIFMHTHTPRLYHQPRYPLVSP